jgi:hypothetical protein
MATICRRAPQASPPFLPEHLQAYQLAQSFCLCLPLCVVNNDMQKIAPQIIYVLPGMASAMTLQPLALDSPSPASPRTSPWSQVASADRKCFWLVHTAAHIQPFNVSCMLIRICCVTAPRLGNYRCMGHCRGAAPHVHHSQQQPKPVTLAAGGRLHSATSM